MALSRRCRWRRLQPPEMAPFLAALDNDNVIYIGFEYIDDTRIDEINDEIRNMPNVISIEPLPRP